MTDDVVVETGARLHFGLLAHSPEIRRRFGGAGVMISGIGFRLRATTAAVDEVVGDAAATARVRQFVAAYRESCAPDNQAPFCRIEVERVIPPHAGLGSGTQLGLAVGRILAVLSGETATPATALARRVRRGLRSGLGIHGFEQGGLLVDGGKRHDDDAVATLVARVGFPREWRFVLIIPHDVSGLSGAAESKAFTEMPAMPLETTDRLCRILLMQLLPAAVEADFEACSEAVYDYGRLVGEYFAPIQGGIFASPAMRSLAADVRKRGYAGIGQSSWGPTMFVLCQNQEHAVQLCDALRDDAICNSWELYCVEPMNSGAVVG